MMYWTLKTTVN